MLILRDMANKCQIMIFKNLEPSFGQKPHHSLHHISHIFPSVCLVSEQRNRITSHGFKKGPKCKLLTFTTKLFIWWESNSRVPHPCSSLHERNPDPISRDTMQTIRYLLHVHLYRIDSMFPCWQNKPL